MTKRKTQKIEVEPASADAREEMVRMRILRIAETHDGYISPETVVQDAEDPESPLHPYFTWSDDEAAHLYRMVQARALIRRVKVTIMRSEAGSGKVSIKVTRAAHSLPDDRTRERGYRPTTEIMDDPEARDALLQLVMREMLAYRRRYAQLTELASLWDAIDEHAEQLGLPLSKPASTSGKGASASPPT